MAEKLNYVGRGDNLDQPPGFEPTRTLLVYIGVGEKGGRSDAVAFMVSQDRFNESRVDADTVFRTIQRIEKGDTSGLDPLDMTFKPNETYEVILHVGPDNWAFASNVMTFKTGTPNTYDDYSGLEWFAPKKAEKAGYKPTQTVRFFNKNSTAATYGFNYFVDISQRLQDGTVMTVPVIIDPSGNNSGSGGPNPPPSPPSGGAGDPGGPP